MASEVPSLLGQRFLPCDCSATLGPANRFLTPYATALVTGKGIRVKLSGDGCQVGENGVKVGNKVLAFALIIRAIAGDGIQ